MSKNPNNWPEFVSETGRPIALALTSGHTACVGTTADPGQPTPLHPMFHREAIVQGCVLAVTQQSNAAALQTNFTPTNNTQPDRDEIISRAIAGMVDEAAKDPNKLVELFTGDGRPDANVLSGRAGFPVRASERDVAWDKFQALNTNSSD